MKKLKSWTLLCILFSAIWAVSISCLAIYDLDHETNEFGVVLVEYKSITTTDGWEFLSRPTNGSAVKKSYTEPPFPREVTVTVTTNSFELNLVALALLILLPIAFLWLLVPVAVRSIIWVRKRF
jgi:hypothetical protein